MTPRRVFGCLHLAAKRKAADDVKMFGLIRTAMHGEKPQAEKFMAALTRIIDA